MKNVKKTLANLKVIFLVKYSYNTLMLCCFPYWFLDVSNVESM